MTIPRVAMVIPCTQVPSVMSTFRNIDGSVLLIAVGDESTPHSACRAFITSLDNSVYLSPDDQQALGYECSPVVGLEHHRATQYWSS